MLKTVKQKNTFKDRFKKIQQ